MDEKVILNKICQGNREALGLLWQAHSRNVLNLAFRMLKDRDEAEDILMDIFYSVPEKIRGFRGDSLIGTWLFRLTVNACLMKLRAQKRHKELEEENIETITESALGNAEERMPSCNTALLEEALSHLPAKTRSMLWLKDAEDLSIKDLKDIYNEPEGTIKAKLSRARHLIVQFLKENSSNANIY